MIAEEAVDQLQENEKLVAGKMISSETYKGESKVDNDQTKLYFIQDLRTLPSHLLQLQLSLSNEMTDFLLCRPNTNQKMGMFHGFTQQSTDLL